MTKVIFYAILILARKNVKGVDISKKTNFLRSNQQIGAPNVLVIDEEGNNLGEMSNYSAKALAREKGLDLVEINPTNRPPICKIMEFGKYKYDLAKKEKKNRENTKVIDLKEIRLTLKIGDHDIEYKAKQARGFFDDGDKVKVSMRLRGRENAFANQAYDVFRKFAAQAGLDYEKTPFKAGNTITAMMCEIKKENK